MRVLLCENNKKGSGFFAGVQPEDLLKKADAQKMVKAVLDNLLKFNVWVEAAVEANEDGYLVIKDTRINEY